MQAKIQKAYPVSDKNEKTETGSTVSDVMKLVELYSKNTFVAKSIH